MVRLLLGSMSDHHFVTARVCLCVCVGLCMCACVCASCDVLLGSPRVQVSNEHNTHCDVMYFFVSPGLECPPDTVHTHCDVLLGFPRARVFTRHHTHCDVLLCFPRARVFTRHHTHCDVLLGSTRSLDKCPPDTILTVMCFLVPPGLWTRAPYSL